VRDRGALITTHVGNAGLEQGLSDGENTLPFEDFSVSGAELFDFLFKGSFSQSDAP
jgi:hypothetical protein